MVAAFNRLNRYARRYKDSQLPYHNTQKEKKEKKKNTHFIQDPLDHSLRDTQITGR